MFAPAFAKSATRRSGTSDIKCTSSGRFVTRRQASTINGPADKLGTKCPSITSTWSQSAPAASTSARAWPSWVKSAERIEAAIFSDLGIRLPVWFNDHLDGLLRCLYQLESFGCLFQSQPMSDHAIYFNSTRTEQFHSRNKVKLAGAIG